MLSTLSNLLRTKVKTPEAAKAAKDISLRRKPVYQGDLDDIEMYFMAAVKEIKKGIGSHYAEQEAMSKKVAYEAVRLLHELHEKADGKLVHRELSYRQTRLPCRECQS